MLRASRSFINLSIKKIRVGSLLVLLCHGQAMAIEEPKYDVIQTDGSFEIRKYAPILVAETLVDGDMDEASSKGFRLIADFIFGNNQVTDSNASSKKPKCASHINKQANNTITNEILKKMMA